MGGRHNDPGVDYLQVLNRLERALEVAQTDDDGIRPLGLEQPSQPLIELRVLPENQSGAGPEL